MKKSSIILLGYGIGYIVLGMLSYTQKVLLSNQALLPLSIASLFFAFAGFFENGWCILVLWAKQELFVVFARISNRYYQIFAKKICMKSEGYKNEKSIEFRIYWLFKRLANMLAKNIRENMSTDSKSVISHFFYFAASISVVLLYATDILYEMNISTSTEQAITLFPLGVMFVNVFFDSERKYVDEKFFDKVEYELRIVKEQTDKIKKAYGVNDQDENIHSEMD